MLDKLKKHWVWAVIATPFLLMFLLHFGIAVSEYTGINFNIEGINAADWFMFAGSYLGGAITLGGVVLTLKHERKVHQHQISIDAINKEKELLVGAISELDFHSIPIIYNHFRELEITNTGYRGVEVAEIQRRISEIQRSANEQLIVITANTEIYANMTQQCSACKTPCGLSKTCGEFREIYDRISKDLYETLSLLSQHIEQCEINVMKDAVIRQYQLENAQCAPGQPLPHSPEELRMAESLKTDVSQNITKLRESTNRMAGYTQREIPQLINLVREYHIIRSKNAERVCFSEKMR